jgi:hypothetical protein
MAMLYRALNAMVVRRSMDAMQYSRHWQALQMHLYLHRMRAKKYMLREVLILMHSRDRFFDLFPEEVPGRNNCHKGKKQGEGING